MDHVKSATESLWQALRVHRRESKGESPRLITVSFDFYMQLRLEATPQMGYLQPSRPERFMGVPIKCARQTTDYLLQSA